MYEMNKFEVQIEKSLSDSRTGFNEIHLLIDDKDFIEILRVFEKPFAELEGYSDLAGNYAWLRAEYTPPEHFLGYGEKDYGEDCDKVGLLECVCGCEYCWPFAARITVSDESVIWSDFEQPHRLTDSPSGYWDYSKLGPFMFSLQEYQQELSKILEFNL
jgi:hypothetical protein